jgi:hypothetical protein
MDLKERISSGELRQHRRQMRGPERYRRRQAQPPAQFAGRQDRLARDIHFGADPRGMFAKRGARLG